MPSDLHSLQNPNTAKLHLYVMQNAHGLIKIGRSSNVDRRRLQLEQQGRCSIEIIHFIPAFGHHEERLHLLLQQYRLSGEWFSGSDDARRAISAALNMTLHWRFALDVGGAERWLETLLDGVADRYWRKRERAVVSRLKAAVTGYGRFERFKDAGWYQLDADIAGVYGVDGGATMYEGQFYDAGDRIFGTYRPRAGKVIMAPVKVEIPPFTRSMEAAVQLWLPTDSASLRRPVANALDCCLAALCDRWCIAEERIKPRDTR
ncbi:GIY-YIG nuclease family protein [Massilia rhizosphaerae]|uniref:GIY-YIG nuclease family protein n=1 Tax=Massilia rhizosphaerae TaxID=2784389 RepID=UPI0018DE1197|nr:GIY-YIG nuclease family protein [Massilia rhizosphaerae]